MSLRQQPEWARHEFVWIGFPSHADLWEDDLAPAQEEVAAFARAIHAEGRGEQVRLVAADPEAAKVARALARPGITVIEEPFGDIWLRDTGPIVVTGAGPARAMSFPFNGWGGKYDLPGDDLIGRRLAEGIGLNVRRAEWILEGGAIDVDGTGLVVSSSRAILYASSGADYADAAATAAQALRDEINRYR